jgi:hypothetical protein
LSAEDPNGLKNFLRMDMASFNELLEMVTPLIKKRDTLMRNSISPAERLALTLRCLAWKIFCTIMKMKWSCGIYQTVIIPRRMAGKGRWRELKKLWIITSLINY